MFRIKCFLALFFISFQTLVYGQMESELILLFEYVPGIHDEIRVVKGQDAPNKVIRRLKQEGIDLRKLQNLIENTDDQVLLFTEFDFEERPAQLGITMETVESGVEVKEVVFEETKKVISEGDIIIGFNGRLVAEPDDLQLELSNYNGGDSVKLTFIREGKEMTRKIDLGQKSMYYLDNEIKPAKIFRKSKISRS